MMQHKAFPSVDGVLPEQQKMRLAEEKNELDNTATWIGKINAHTRFYMGIDSDFCVSAKIACKPGKGFSPNGD